MSEDWKEPDSAGEAGSPQTPPEEGGEVARPPGEEDQAAADIGTRALSEAARVAFFIMLIAMAGIAAFYLYRSVFWVPLNEVEIKLRFGRPVKVDGSYVMDSESGYHFKWPFEELVTVPTHELALELDTEFMPRRRKRTESELKRMAEQGIKLSERGIDVKTDGFLITGDANIVHLKMKLRYAVGTDERDLLDYAFAFRGPAPKPGEKRKDTPERLLKRFAVQSTIETVGSWTVEDVRNKYRTTQGGARRYLQEEIRGRIAAKLNAYRRTNGSSLGVKIEGVELTEGPKVPVQVQAAFDAARDAEVQMAQGIHEADKERQEILGRARRRRTRTLQAARTYGDRLVKSAKADADMLQTLRDAYGESPEAARIMRSRQFHRMIEELFAASEDSFVFHVNPEGADQELQIMLSPVSRTLKNRLRELQQKQEAPEESGSEHQH